jgi:hypothetical protein
LSRRARQFEIANLESMKVDVIYMSVGAGDTTSDEKRD